MGLMQIMPETAADLGYLPRFILPLLALAGLVSRGIFLPHGIEAIYCARLNSRGV